MSSVGYSGPLAHLEIARSPAEGERNGRPVIPPPQMEGQGSPLVGDPSKCWGTLLSRLLRFELFLNFNLKHAVVISSRVFALVE